VKNDERLQEENSQKTKRMNHPETKTKRSFIRNEPSDVIENTNSPEQNTSQNSMDLSTVKRNFKKSNENISPSEMISDEESNMAILSGGTRKFLQNYNSDRSEPNRQHRSFSRTPMLQKSDENTLVHRQFLREENSEKNSPTRKFIRANLSDDPAPSPEDIPRRNFTKINQNLSSEKRLSYKKENQNFPQNPGNSELSGSGTPKHSDNPEDSEPPNGFRRQRNFTKNLDDDRELQRREFKRSSNLTALGIDQLSFLGGPSVDAEKELIERLKKFEDKQKKFEKQKNEFLEDFSKKRNELIHSGRLLEELWVDVEEQKKQLEKDKTKFKYDKKELLLFQKKT